MRRVLLGHHIGTKYGFTTTVDYAKSHDVDVFQMFLRSPQSFKQKRRSNEDLEIVRKKALHNNIKILIHANYMLNFCNPTLHKKACKVLIEDLEDSIKLNAIGVVVHMGHNTKKLKITNEEAINNYVNGIKNVLKNSPKNNAKGY